MVDGKRPINDGAMIEGLSYVKSSRHTSADGKGGSVRRKSRTQTSPVPEWKKSLRPRSPRICSDCGSMPKRCNVARATSTLRPPHVHDAPQALLLFGVHGERPAKELHDEIVRGNAPAGELPQQCFDGGVHVLAWSARTVCRTKHGGKHGVKDATRLRRRMMERHRDT